MWLQLFEKCSKFSQEQPAMMAGQSLEPNGLHSPKAHLCEYGYAILKNALAFDN